ncbi:hypothetical protein [Vibrio diazotrophicus]|uniref:hypothetical protein n=1 Tax=Vibrio diazotrophicus TaxID=685 RepID=UPI0006945B66|nr:hypothetical protein [Vibrio diazotrophicus]
MISIVISADTVALATLVISAFAALYAWQAVRLKKSIKIQSQIIGGHTPIGFTDKYPKTILLQNLKDKSEAIFGIYMKVGHNLYIKLEDLQDDPIIIGPFETISRTYGPVSLYGMSMRRLDLNRILDDQKIKKQIVLHTSHGRHVTKTRKKYWNPIQDVLSGSGIGLATAHWITEPKLPKIKSIPFDAKYVVEIQNDQDKRYSYITETGNKDLGITQEHLKNPDELIEVIEKTFGRRDYHPSSIRIISVKENQELAYLQEFYQKNVEFNVSSWFLAYITNKPVHWYQKWKMSETNFNRNKKSIYKYRELTFIKFGLMLLFIVLATIAITGSFT